MACLKAGKFLSDFGYNSSPLFFFVFSLVFSFPCLQLRGIDTVEVLMLKNMGDAVILFAVLLQS